MAVAKGADLRIERPDLRAAPLADGEQTGRFSAFDTAQKSPPDDLQI
jgi:hypothetical protein